MYYLIKLYQKEKIVTKHKNLAYGLEKSGLGGKDRGVEDTSGGGDNLSTSTVNSVSVKGDVMKIESDSTHVFVAKNSLFGGPVETGFDGILENKLIVGINLQIVSKKDV